MGAWQLDALTPAMVVESLGSWEWNVLVVMTATFTFNDLLLHPGVTQCHVSASYSCNYGNPMSARVNVAVEGLKRFFSLVPGVCCSAPAPNGLDRHHHPHPRGSYSPLPHIHLGNGGGPSWPGDLPHYTLFPDHGTVQGPVQRSSAGARRTSAAQDCLHWVERTNQALTGQEVNRRLLFLLVLSSLLFSPQRRTRPSSAPRTHLLPAASRRRCLSRPET